MGDTATEAVVSFLRDRPPFDALDEAQLREVAAHILIESFPRDAPIIRQGGEPAAFLYVVRSGSVEIRDQGRVVDLPGEGEVFGELSLLTSLEPTASVVSHEDTICYLVEADAARRLLGSPGGAAFVQASLKRVLTHALDHRSASAIQSAIREAGDEKAAIAAGRGLPSTVCSLVEAGADAVEIGRVVGSTIDALASRLIDFAISDAGDPPVPWAWLALGSEARLEQALHTDQDHALAYDAQGAATEEIDPYFARLAEAVTAGLESAGIPRCNGDAMAVTPSLRRSIDGWREAYSGWMSDPGTDGSVLTSIAFDYRKIAGPLEVEPVLDVVVATAPAKYPQFLRHLAQRALDNKPPTGFFKDFVVEGKGEHAGRLDIKHGGITIIGNLARAYTVREGRREKSTLDRLRAAETTGQLNAERREALEEAFRLLWQTRLEHQVSQVQAGVEPDDYVDPKTLGPITRQGLKEAFKIVGNEQKMLAADLGVGY